ncbi:MAG: Crp/Fnr family transcriptional regulator [Reichenbachiella sp.]|uniref:Crp/Fnr family transcriptional regulator n=1 Tax=Reichenbachiella sp. TaxID=2184521 RepID=UPI002966C672|nr:Crp/Fnr family transcriptional regulator [Reichenbachiella sp.]MDW3210625.1 Crp/Fnr family transcriptional regulator [Reichenbachiella sp.]
MKDQASASSYDLIFQNVGRFIDLTDEEKDLFKSLLKSGSAKRKEFVMRPGKMAKYEYFVTKGCLKVYSLDRNGVEHVSMFAIEDFWTGDMASFMLEQPASYFIKALEDSEFLMISKESFEGLFQKIPKFERFYRNLYQRSLVSYIERTNQGISLTAEERYEIFLTKYPHIAHRITQKDLAAYLGITPEFLSMIRSKMSKR